MRETRARCTYGSAALAVIAGIIGIAAAGGSAFAQSNSAEPTLPQPKSAIVDASLTKQQSQAAVLTAERFYAFWETGSSALAEQVVAPTFRDHMSSRGGQQGRAALEHAVAQLRAAVPDLSCTIEELLVVGDRAVARLKFSGTEGGKSQGGSSRAKARAGKPVKFTAIDILRLQNGQVVEAWRAQNHSSLIKTLDKSDSTAKRADGAAEGDASAADGHVGHSGAHAQQ